LNRGGSAVDYLRTRLQAGDAGKTLLVGLRQAQPCLAIAAGLRGGQDHPRFITLAGYLLRREQADAYWLAVPAVTGSGEILALEIHSAGVSRVAHCPARFAAAPADCELEMAGLHPARPLLDDLLSQAGNLPGRMRRDLDQLAIALAIPLPPQGVGE